MEDSPERTSKRRRLCEPSGVADSSPPFQPEAFIEEMEWMDSLGHSSSYNSRHTNEDPFEADPTISLETHSILLENINCEEDSAIHIGVGVETISHDIIDSENETVCFGMITSITARCERPRSSITSFAVTLESYDRFRATEGTQLRGVILSQYGPIIQGLLDDETLTLFASCTIDSDFPSRRPATSSSQAACSLEITVYGPAELSNEIGQWFQDYNVYLQDPRVCHLDTRYWNPHRLSSIDLKLCSYVSQVVLVGSGSIHFQEIEEQPDMLDIISGQEDLEEAAAPEIIRSSLHRHQKQALTFMLLREKGWALETKGSDIWEALDSSHQRIYLNRITDVHQNEAPPQFYGGIVADPMGLGKTLTMIALVATDLELRNSLITEDDLWEDPEYSKPSIKATLVIVTPPLLDTWEKELSQHVVKDGMKFRRHHKKDRIKHVHETETVNIVLTTYDTISADWNKEKGSARQFMFSVRWKRIILDEAHLIRNIKTRKARAICDLESSSRWAVTGTPIQNHISDLTTLLKFIRAHPYNDPKRFEADISQLWKSGRDKEALNRLKHLSRCLILRRAKRTIELPPRHDKMCKVDFSKAERAFYDNIRQQTITKIDDALHHDTGPLKPGTFVNFLQQIESMRLICNLGLHYNTRHEKAQGTADWASEAQKAFNLQREIGIMICYQCRSTLEMTESAGDDILHRDPPQFFRCNKYVCTECSYLSRINGEEMVCECIPSCSVAPISVSNSAFEEISGNISTTSITTESPPSFPSKVEALVCDLKGVPPDVKSIVFSTWRLTLDIVESALNQEGIQNVRLDGKVPQTQRQPMLDDFKLNPDVRVILLTLQCGAVGLTLTEASRAYLMEPNWNPTIEEQALARIHRIGQTREVTTIRFCIRDSFEERVIETQESKKNLASVLLSGHDGGPSDVSLKALEKLRYLL